MKPHNTGNFPWRTAGLVGAMGMNVGVCLICGYALGNWLSGKFGGPALAWKAGGLLLGLFAAIWSVVRIVQKVLGDADE